MLTFSSVADLAVDAIKEVNEDETDEEVQVETEEENTVKKHWDEMIDNTSFHGISYIVDHRYPIRRVLWFAITITAFIYSLLKVHESTMEYLDYPFTTSIMRK